MCPVFKQRAVAKPAICLSQRNMITNEHDGQTLAEYCRSLGFELDQEVMAALPLLSTQIIAQKKLDMLYQRLRTISQFLGTMTVLQHAFTKDKQESPDLQHFDKACTIHKAFQKSIVDEDGKRYLMSMCDEYNAAKHLESYVRGTSTQQETNLSGDLSCLREDGPGILQQREGFPTVVVKNKYGTKLAEVDNGTMVKIIGCHIDHGTNISTTEIETIMGPVHVTGWVQNYNIQTTIIADLAASSVAPTSDASPDVRKRCRTSP